MPACLKNIARSLKAGGFKTICFIADHGGSMKVQAEVAARLTREWSQEGIRVIDVDDYYVGAGDLQNKFLESQGERPAAIGQHAGIADTSELMAVHPAGVDLSRHSAFGLPKPASAAIRAVRQWIGARCCSISSASRGAPDQGREGWDVERLWPAVRVIEQEVGFVLAKTGVSF